MVDAASVLDRAKAKGITIATAESCSGGLVAAALTEVAGSSAVFDSGFVTYSNDAKTRMLGVPPAIFEQHGAVSEQCALAMAEGALEHSQASLSVAITGIAGPGGSAHKPEGHVCFATAHAGATKTTTIQFGALGRSQVRQASVETALDLLLQALAEIPG